MKKLFIAVMAAMLCMGFVLPAAADVKITGLVWVDAYIRDLSPELEAGGVLSPPFGTGTTLHDGLTDFQINGPMSQNYLNFAYVNAKGTFGANLTFLGGYINDWVTWQQLGFQSHIWWKPMANLTLRVGKIDQFMGGLFPTIGVGNSEYYRNLQDPADIGTFGGQGIAGGAQTGFVPAAITFGNLHSTAKPGIDAAYVINQNFTFKVALFDPDYDGVENDRFDFLNEAGTTARQAGVLPRVDIGLPIRFGKFYIQPKAGFLRKEYDQVAQLPAPQDDSFDIYVYGADASFTFGPVTLAGEYAWGQNLGAGNFTGGLSTLGPRAVAGSIIDTETEMWWAEIRWNITPRLLLNLSYGILEFTDDGNALTAADDFFIERTSYAVNLRYALAPNFFIHPSWSRTMYGENNKVGAGTATMNSGELDMYGISFYMLF